MQGLFIEEKGQTCCEMQSAQAEMPAQVDLQVLYLLACVQQLLSLVACPCPALLLPCQYAKRFKLRSFRDRSTQAQSTCLLLNGLCGMFDHSIVSIEGYDGLQNVQLHACARSAEAAESPTFDAACASSCPSPVGQWWAHTKLLEVIRMPCTVRSW